MTERRRVLFPFFLFRATIGFTLGLYLYTNGSVIYDGLNKASGGLPISLFGLSMTPLAWTAFVFSFGILQEMFLEVPTGVLADSLGRRFVTLVNLMCRVAFFAFLYLIWREGEKAAPSATLIVIYSVTSTTLFSIHYSLMSGSFVAWFRDALEDIKDSESFPRLLNKGYMVSSSLYMVGSIAGVYLKIIERIDVAFLSGLGLCTISALLCRRYMPENKSFKFYKMSDLWGHARKEMFAKSRDMVVKGWETFSSDSRLWVVFATVASCFSVLYVIDYVWLIYVRSQFGASLKDFSFEWLGLILAFAASDFVGAFLISRRKTYPLVPTTIALCIFFTIPIFIAAILPPNLMVFIACMTVHRIAWGALHGPLDAIQNAYIPANSQQRSTVLSLGACLKNLFIVVLFYFGVGKDAGSMTAWVLPALAVVTSAVVMGVWIHFKESSATQTARHSLGAPSR